MQQSSFPSISLEHVTMTDCPIRPEWIVAGEPKARVADLMKSSDGSAYNAIWDCTAGKFYWYFWADEWVHILDGEVTVTLENGETKTLRPGDLAFFPAESWALWNVPEYLRKHAFVQENATLLGGLLLNLLGRMRGRFKGRPGGAIAA
jgi:uncharacterized cupin superfamily protein